MISNLPKFDFFMKFEKLKFLKFIRCVGATVVWSFYGFLVEHAWKFWCSDSQKNPKDAWKIIWSFSKENCWSDESYKVILAISLGIIFSTKFE